MRADRPVESDWEVGTVGENRETRSESTVNHGENEVENGASGCTISESG
jgi:hypothetical protein